MTTEMQLKAVALDAWCALEDALAQRYPRSPWRPRMILRGLLRFAWWRIPSAEEAHEQTGGLSRQGLARRRVQAAAELDMMEQLPQLTRGVDLAVLEQKVAFGVVPASAIIRQQDRQLSFFHVWALCDRRVTAELVCRLVGDRWIVPLAVLEEELQRRQDEEAVELVKLHQARARESKAESRSGPEVIAITF